MPNDKLKSEADGKPVNIPVLTLVAKEGRRRPGVPAVGIAGERVQFRFVRIKAD